MSKEPISDLLTKRQIELLELVSSGITASKDLSEVTGLSPMYVDKVLYQAAKKLGVRDRSAAVRHLSIIKASDPRSDVRPQGLLNPTEFGFSNQATVEPAAPSKLRSIRGPNLGGGRHELRSDQVLLRIMWVAAIGGITVMALVLVVLSFFKTFS